jgi:hypothetical protein
MRHQTKKPEIGFTQFTYGTLPMVLWQYDLITLQQLDQIDDCFDSIFY